MLQIRTIAAFEHQHAKNFVVDVPLDKRRCARKDFVQIQRSINLFPDLRQRRQNFRGNLRAAVRFSWLRLSVSGIHSIEHYNRRARPVTDNRKRRHNFQGTPGRPTERLL